jgi:glutamate synthase (NADPH) large chain
MISDEEYKGALARKNPYQEWLKNQEITMDMLPKSAPPTVPADLHMAMLRAFGYTTETLEMLLQPMAFDAMEGLGSMGNDVPLACISQRPRTIFDYFKQLFAQVAPSSPSPLPSVHSSLLLSSPHDGH